jgi:hypothetical protein
MTRSIQRLALLVSSILAVAALAATAAQAGDRYGSTDGRADGYAAGDYGYPPDVDPGRADYDQSYGGYGDSRRDAQSSRSRYEYERRDSRAQRSFDGQVDDAEQVDPCAVQYRLTGRRCGGDDAAPGHHARLEEGRFSRRGDDLEQVDPCAIQSRVAGRGCASDEQFYGGGARVSREGSAWRSERVYGDERGWAYARNYGARGYDDRSYGDGYRDDGYVDACVVAHERIGERCPYAEGRREQDRVVWVEERLPDTFFISEGGVGPGIVDFGGGGGGGGGFAFADGFANANASASASASAQASVSVSIAAHNHRMMMGYPHKMMHGGCGCKKGY